MAAAILLAVALVALSSPAAAGDGRIEINQASIISGPTGYPFTIGAPGSYVLTSDLVVPDATTGIRVDADGVFLDLNGFAIRGSHVCDQVTCALGTGYGIERVASATDKGNRVTVVDGGVSARTASASPPRRTSSASSSGAAAGTASGSRSGASLRATASRPVAASA